MFKIVTVSTKAIPLDPLYSLAQSLIGTSTRLLLNLTRDFDSVRHVFPFRLISASGPVGGKNITLTLNQTQKYTSKQPTNAAGYARARASSNG